VTPGYSPSQTVLDPNGLYLYMLATSSNSTVTVFNIAAGALTNAGFTPSITGANDLLSGTVDPCGGFLYVSENGNNAIYAFQISQTDGSLTPVTGSPFTTNGPLSVLVDHSGKYLYVVNSGGNTVSSYSIDQTLTATGGALTPIGTPAPTGPGPKYSVMDPAGTHIYVPNNTDGTVTTVSIGAGGALTTVGTTTVGNPSTVSVLNVAVDPTDKYLYVLDNGVSGVGAVYGFTLTSGVPSTTPISAAVATGNVPNGIVVDATSVLVAVDNSSDGTISLYTIGSGGVLTSQTPVAAGDGPLFVTFYNAP
jgi:6-phosphogluconolactonase